MIESLWYNKAVLEQKSGSILVQVMPCYLTAPSHYLHQRWLLISEVQWQSSMGNFATLTARFMGPTWGPSGADRTQVGPMLASWTLLSGKGYLNHQSLELALKSLTYKFSSLRPINWFILMSESCEHFVKKILVVMYSVLFSILCLCHEIHIQSIFF